MEAETTAIVSFAVTESFPLVLAIVLRELESPIPGEVESHANLKFFQGGPSGTLLLDFDNPDDFSDSRHLFRRTLNAGTYTFVGTTSFITLKEDVLGPAEGSITMGPIPEPATFSLMAAAVATAALYSKFKPSQRTSKIQASTRPFAE
jgi:hypothetical protein